MTSLSGWCVLLLFWLGLFFACQFLSEKKIFKKFNGITEATYPSILGVVNFCHDITGAIYFGWAYFLLANFYEKIVKGITEATYPSILGDVYFCHDIARVSLQSISINCQSIAALNVMRAVSLS